MERARSANFYKREIKNSAEYRRISALANLGTRQLDAWWRHLHDVESAEPATADLGESLVEGLSGWLVSEPDTSVLRTDPIPALEGLTIDHVLAALHSPNAPVTALLEDERVAPIAASEFQFVLERGAALHLPDAHLFCPELEGVCSLLRSCIGGQNVRATLYLSRPGSNPASSPHFDPSPILVWQISGNKLWHIWDRVALTTGAESPTWHGAVPSQPDSLLAAIADMPPSYSRRHIRGQFLYVRRGDYHVAFPAGDEIVAHVTFMLFPATVAECVNALVNNALDELPVLRRQLNWNDPAVAEEQVSAALRALNSGSSPSIQAFFADRLISSDTGGPGGQYLLSRRDHLENDLQLLRSDMPAKLVGRALFVPGFRVELSGDDERRAVEIALDRGRSHTLEDFISVVGDAGVAVALVGELLSIGVLLSPRQNA
ncbi:MAG: hypothetical protein H0X25_06725 [Acidobacteriales bacterium]|nr:hypothetical protein [Terriglobales bacterium]